MFSCTSRCTSQRHVLSSFLHVFTFTIEIALCFAWVSLFSSPPRSCCTTVVPRRRLSADCSFGILARPCRSTRSTHLSRCFCGGFLTSFRFRLTRSMSPHCTLLCATAETNRGRRERGCSLSIPGCRSCARVYKKITKKRKGAVSRRVRGLFTLITSGFYFPWNFFNRMVLLELSNTILVQYNTM